eukprot:TRINITY_DN49332_c0_g1_i1.p1 TRINITY_DN49332_c0_g1~~TRINITY_DN49332_c0_g1_i1.p1  ORF type:complete len:374 (+),score=89.96 TRINITY_DN49332_c0_g1_i1:353-1474(+)
MAAERAKLQGEQQALASEAEGRLQAEVSKLHRSLAEATAERDQQATVAAGLSAELGRCNREQADADRRAEEAEAVLMDMQQELDWRIQEQHDREQQRLAWQSPLQSRPATEDYGAREATLGVRIGGGYHVLRARKEGRDCSPSRTRDSALTQSADGIAGGTFGQRASAGSLADNVSNHAYAHGAPARGTSAERYRIGAQVGDKCFVQERPERPSTAVGSRNSKAAATSWSSGTVAGFAAEGAADEQDPVQLFRVLTAASRQNAAAQMRQSRSSPQLFAELEQDLRSSGAVPSQKTRQPGRPISARRHRYSQDPSYLPRQLPEQRLRLGGIGHSLDASLLIEEESWKAASALQLPPPEELHPPPAGSREDMLSH